MSSFRLLTHRQLKADSAGWDLLALAETCIPAISTVHLEEGVTQVDYREPITVPDPRSTGRALFRVRFYFNGNFLVHAFDQSTADGLFVLVHCCFGPSKEGERKATHGEWSTRPLFKGTLSLQDCMSPTPARGTINGGGLLDFKSRDVTLAIVVKERRFRPVPFPSSCSADRQTGAFCDVTLQAEGQLFPAHRVILAAASDVFRTMFTADFKEKSSGRVDVAGTSARAFAKFLDFVYTDYVPEWQQGCVPKWLGCELELLELASLYQVLRLKRLCEERIWLLGGESALSLLLRAANKPVLAPAMQLRLCRQVAREASVLEDTPDWQALQTASPYTAGVVTGILGSGGTITSITHTAEGLQAK